MFEEAVARRSTRGLSTRKLLIALAIPALLVLVMAHTALGAGYAPSVPAGTAAAVSPAPRVCTAGPDYWQSHLDDPAWESIDSGAPFFASGFTWNAVLAPAPASDIYHQLARQYVSTRLNLAGGAEPASALEWALVWADRYFTNNTPSSPLIKPDYEMALQNIAIFERYNTGVIGPGGCGE